MHICTEVCERKRRKRIYFIAEDKRPRPGVGEDYDRRIVEWRGRLVMALVKNNAILYPGFTSGN